MFSFVSERKTCQVFAVHTSKFSVTIEKRTRVCVKRISYVFVVMDLVSILGHHCLLGILLLDEPYTCDDFL